MSYNTKRAAIDDIPEWSPLHGKAIRRVNARRAKNRENTEKCIFDAMTVIARRGGIHTLKINQLATEAKVSKELIYRYYGSLAGLIDLYATRTMQTLDAESQAALPKNPTLEEVRSVIKRMYRTRSELYYKNPDLRIVVRDLVFELSHGKERDLGRIRPTSIILKRALASFTHIPEAQIDAFDAVVMASHAGLMLYMDCSTSLNNIDFHSETQREQLHAMIDSIIDDWLDRQMGSSAQGEMRVNNQPTISA